MGKSKVMPISMDGKLYDVIVLAAKKAGMGRSELIRDLAENYLDLVVNDGEEKPVVLRIPAHLASDEAQLRSWLSVKTEVIVKALCSPD